MREVSIALVQMKPDLGEMEDNLVKMSDFISKIASQQKVDLILFPELVTSGYEMGVKFTDMAQQVPGPTINLLSQRAQEMGVYIGFGMVAKEKVESILYNTAVLIGPDGDVIGNYHKTHLRGEERMAFREGYKLPVFETEFGLIGLMLGWDLAFPEVGRSMTLEGAELLCVLGNWERQYIDEWKTLLKARAYENACYVAGVNRVGEDVTLSFGGESMLVGPRGRTYAHLPGEEEAEAAEEEAKKDEDEAKDEAEAKSEDEGEKEEEKKDEKKKEKAKPRFLEGYAVAKIDLDDIRRHREEFQNIQTRQPRIYRAVVRKY
jgi:predicted amidohydrolase